MSTYIRAVVAAEVIEEKHGIPLGDLVDTFADIPAADVAPVVHAKLDIKRCLRRNSDDANIRRYY